MSDKTYFIEDDTVYEETVYPTFTNKKCVGLMDMVEAERIDENTVADVSYQFDLQLGKYVEQSRTTRAEPEPPEPITIDQKVSQIESTALVLDERTLGMQAIDDFTLQQQATIDERTAGMQEIDDYTLQMILDLQQTVADLTAEVQQLKGGV